MKYSTGPKRFAQVVCDVRTVWKLCPVTTKTPALNRCRWRGRTVPRILIHSIAVPNQPLCQVTGQFHTPTNCNSNDTISVIIRTGRPGCSERDEYVC
jgi:hypothetical protein